MLARLIDSRGRVLDLDVEDDATMEIVAPIFRSDRAIWVNEHDAAPSRQIDNVRFWRAPKVRDDKSLVVFVVSSRQRWVYQYSITPAMLVQSRFDVDEEVTRRAVGVDAVVERIHVRPNPEGEGLRLLVLGTSRPEAS